MSADFVFLSSVQVKAAKDIKVVCCKTVFSTQNMVVQDIYAIYSAMTYKRSHYTLIY